MAYNSSLLGTMYSVLITLLTFVMQIYSKEQATYESAKLQNRTSNLFGKVPDTSTSQLQESVGKPFNAFVDVLVDNVFERAIKVQPFQNSDFDKTMFRRPPLHIHTLQRPFISPSRGPFLSSPAHVHPISSDLTLHYQPQFAHGKSLARHLRKAVLESREGSAPAVQAAASQRAAVIGAGPAGLLTAIMLARRGWKQISVFDSLTAPPLPDDAVWGVGERSYQLGLNGRGQSALSEFGVMERVDSYSAKTNGRLSFDAKTSSPTEARYGAERTYVGRILQRDRLQSSLVEEIKERYPQVSVNFGVACQGVDLSGDLPEVKLCTPTDVSEEDALECQIGTIQKPQSFDLVVGADGVRSAVRESLSEVEGSNTRTVRFPDNNERRYKTLLLHPSAVPGTASDLNWSGGNKTLNLQMEALPTKEGEMIGVLLFKPDTPVYKEIENLRTGAQARSFFEHTIPSLLPYLRDDDLESFIKRPINRFPTFQLVEGDIHFSMPRGGVVLLGDAIKAVKPYFGQGANSALEDVSVLSQCLKHSFDNPATAVAAFSRVRAEQARTLVRTSRSFDRPGPLGTARFVLPLIVDSILNKMMPAVFSPPILRGMQDVGKTLIELRQRKLAERVLLVVLLIGLATSVVKLFVFVSFVLRRVAVPV